ncbi:venom protein R precursor [Nasonia vitripennis]|uniref:Salivary secreted peptide n=1 Tax=Nasonia vitripennis TaxID=7425 RepID=A0A7M6UD48_NASVI|nr:venom protein R precursor [Nasonia vitripennis]
MARQLIFAALAVALAVVAVNSTPYYGGAYQQYAAAPNKSHNLIIGNRQAGDRLVYQENIVKPSKWLQVIEVKKSFNITGYLITQIRAMDQKTNGNGAIASRVDGGVGYSNVTLKFKSQRSHGINFVVQIYARPRYY